MSTNIVEQYIALDPDDKHLVQVIATGYLAAASNVQPSGLHARLLRRAMARASEIKKEAWAKVAQGAAS